MKILSLSVLCLAAGGFAFAQVPSPIFQENFNVRSSGLVLKNGATTGGPGTGVSGRPDDRAYIGQPRSSEQEHNGPIAEAIVPIAPDSLSSFTATFWYYLDKNGPNIQVPLNTAGVLFLLMDKGLEVRIENQPEQPRAYIFTPGSRGPLAHWFETDRWIFAVISWNQETNTMTVHQGTPEHPVVFMRTLSRGVPARPSMPRMDLIKHPESIGNTIRPFDRPIAGRMDNVRFFDREITAQEAETIRLADLANKPINLK